MSVSGKATRNGQTQLFSIKNKETVLEAMKSANLEPPYSCQSGICGNCKAKLVNGTVNMRKTIALDANEQAQGYILCCQAEPTSNSIEIKYD